LAAIANARIEYDWGHTSSLMALIANCHRDPKAKPFQPRDFNPLAPPVKRQMVPITALKDVFIASSK